MIHSIQKILAAALLTSSSLMALNITSATFNNIDQGWNSEQLAKLYFHHSETQRQWAWEMLSKVTFTGDEKVLDFGCRDGKISAEMARIAKNGSVCAIDVSKPMIHLAKMCFPSFAFPNLTFHNSASFDLEDFPGKQDCDYVCAFTVFHLLPNPLETLKTLKTHLKSSGKLLIIIPTGKNPELYQAACEIFPKYGLELPWLKKNPTSGSNMRSMEGCTAFLEEAGFQVESMEIVSTDNPFYSREACIAWHMGTATATWQIPADKSEAFFTDIIDRMVELNPSLIDEEGRFHFVMPRMHVIATPH